MANWRDEFDRKEKGNELITKRDERYVITVSRSTWMTTKQNGVATDLFCTGVIDHPMGMILNQDPKTLI